MEKYVLSVCAVAVLCSFWHSLTPEGPARKRVWHLGTLILVLAVLSPLISVEGETIRGFRGRYETEMERWEQETEQRRRQLLEADITDRCRTYIWKQMGQEPGTMPELSFRFRMEQGLPVPDWAYLTGTCPEKIQTRLKQILEQDLGIPPERQVWRLS